MIPFFSSSALRTVAVAAACFAAGGATVYFVTRPDTHAPGSAATTQAPAATAPPVREVTGPLPDLVVPMPADLAQRAGLEVVRVARGTVRSTLRASGAVAPNQYRQVQVSSTVGGQVTSVSAQLGDRVRRGTALAQIFSSELAESQTRYLTVRAELVAADERLARTKRLVTIGAASQQELEQTQAERTKAATEVEGIAARLRLSGMSPAAIGRLQSAVNISSTIAITAPADGVITERTANAGMVIMPSVPLFVISSVSPVWVIADLAERDATRVKVGTPATVHVDAASPVAGKIVYIAPDVRPETRTTQVRIEIPNPSGQLRFGMLVTVELSDAIGATVLTVPDAALQTIAGRSFVYVVPAGKSGEFIEREVTTGNRSNGTVEIRSGLAEGDRVVSTGSFYVRAERERLGLRERAPAAGSQARTIEVAVTAKGFEPARVEVPSGTRVTLQITRKVESTCGTDVAVGGKKVVDSLPMNKPVDIDLGIVTRGEVTFTCGMNMLKGTIVVQVP